jgi:hypothetical protein
MSGLTSAATSRQFQLPIRRHSLRLFHQRTDAFGIRLGMTMTRQGIAAAGGLDQNVRPENSRLDMHRCHLGDADADLVLAEQPPFVTDDRHVRHLDDGGKQMIAARPPARFEKF